METVKAVSAVRVQANIDSVQELDWYIRLELNMDTSRDAMT